MRHIISECSPVRLDPDTEGVTFTALRGERGSYNVRFPAADHIVFVVGAKRGSELANLEDARIARRLDVDHHFKHYGSGGRKWWTTEDGTDLYIVVPKAALTLLPVFGYSYPEVEVGGQTVRLSVSGGTYPAGQWTDSVDEQVSTLVDLPVATVNGLLSAALTADECEAQGYLTAALASQAA